MAPGTVRCKATVASVVTTKNQDSDDGLQRHIHFAGVQATEGEDSIFGKYTPVFNLDMLVVNAAAARKLEVGKAYYIDFSPAEEASK